MAKVDDQKRIIAGAAGSLPMLYGALLVAKVGSPEFTEVLDKMATQAGRIIGACAELRALDDQADVPTETRQDERHHYEEEDDEDGRKDPLYP